MTLKLATYDLFLEVQETPALGVPTVADPDVTHRITLASVTSSAQAKPTLSTSTTPAVSKVWGDTLVLSSGSVTFDLTALDQGNLPNLDFTGLKVQFVKIASPATNTADLNFDVGVTNGYRLFGDTAAGEIVLGIGGVCLFYNPEALPDVGATAKTIDVTSTDDDATFEILLVAG